MGFKGGQQIVVGGKTDPDGLIDVELVFRDRNPHAVGTEIPADPLQHQLLLIDGDRSIDDHARKGTPFLGIGKHANILCWVGVISWVLHNCAGLPKRTLIQCGSFLKRGAVYR